MKKVPRFEGFLFFMLAQFFPLNQTHHAQYRR
jgi:hypothetical protein